MREAMDHNNARLLTLSRRRIIFPHSISERVIHYVDSRIVSEDTS
jgi:hypothetical protein